VEKIVTHILCSITFFRVSCHLWDNVEKYGGARGATNDVIIWRIRCACWISKLHTRTRMLTPGHPHACTYASALAHIYKYLIFIAFPHQRWFRKRTSVLRYTFIACHVSSRFGMWKKNETPEKMITYSLQCDICRMICKHEGMKQ
jgi:hypothetical protein